MAKSNDILIDTNILIYMYENKKDIFDIVSTVIPYPKFYVLDKVYDEIEKVYKNKPVKKKLLIKYLEKLKNANKFKVIEVPKEIFELSPKYTKIDNLLIHYSNKYIIYTNDRKLKIKIKERKNKVLILKLNGVLLI
jgi:rRNA-processing protein FCF1